MTSPGRRRRGRGRARGHGGCRCSNAPPRPSRAPFRGRAPLLHELAREGPKFGKLVRVLRRDCEPEMMPVLFAPFGESLRVGVVEGCVEHPGICAVAGHSVALQVGDMLRERRGTTWPPWWRTTRAMTTTRRLGDREARDSAARRPRPKVERPAVPLLRLNVWPRWPASSRPASPPQRALGRWRPGCRDGCDRAAD